MGGLSGRRALPRRRLAPDARRDELIVAAEALLRTRGARATRVEDVVRAAGAAKGTFYLYFATWEDLLAAIRERLYADFDRRFVPQRLPATPDEWWALVETVADGFVDFVLGLEGLHEAIFHGRLAERRPPAPGDDGAARIAALLQAGTAAGVFAPLDPEPAARVLFAMLHETVDAIAAGADRQRQLATMRALLRRCLEIR